MGQRVLSGSVAFSLGKKCDMTAGRKNVDTLSRAWCTPQKYVTAVSQTFGGLVELDPCSNRWSIVNARTAWSLPDTDGLQQVWAFPTIYVNPPYGSDRERGTRISDWLAKCANAFEDFGSEVIALVPVAGNTLHWKESVWARAAGVCFLYDTRLRLLANGKDKGIASILFVERLTATYRSKRSLLAENCRRSCHWRVYNDRVFRALPAMARALNDSQE
jgi:hypothetical protein